MEGQACTGKGDRAAGNAQKGGNGGMKNQARTVKGGKAGQVTVGMRLHKERRRGERNGWRRVGWVEQEELKPLTLKQAPRTQPAHPGTKIE